VGPPIDAVLTLRGRDEKRVGKFPALARRHWPGPAAVVDALVAGLKHLGLPAVLAKQGLWVVGSEMPIHAALSQKLQRAFGPGTMKKRFAHHVGAEDAPLNGARRDLGQKMANARLGQVVEEPFDDP
jgi:hypothetical protein